MADTQFLVIQIVLTALPAAWMMLGVLDNIRYPDINRNDVSRVLRLDSLEEWPEVYARVSHRRITDPRAVRFIFGLIVFAECLAAVLLSAGAIALAAQLTGLWPGGVPLLLARAGALVFTCVWGGMLIGGQWFYYWYGDFGQQTHLLALIWGMCTLLALTA